MGKENEMLKMLKSSPRLSIEVICEVKTYFNPFHATDLFLHPLKTSENLWFDETNGMRRVKLKMIFMRTTCIFIKW